MNAPNLLKSLLVSLAGISLASGAPRPNIVFIVADDLGWMDTAVYGSKYYETPAIDALAQKGIRFTEAYSASPLCSPTRASLLTGQYPGRIRLTTPACHLPKVVLDPQVPKSAAPHQKAATPATRTRFPNDYLTYAEILRDQAGYATAFMGKWHLGHKPYLPEEQGFDLVVGGRHHPGPPPPGGFFAPWNIDTIPAHPKGTPIATAITDSALDFIDNHKDGPFLLNMWYYDVHAPFQTTQTFLDKYKAKVDPREKQDCPTMGGMIEIMDTNIARLVAKLEELDLRENTLIIFTSDNGGNMYNSVEGTPPTNNAPLRSGKGNAYEGGCRVPLIVSWPGKFKPAIDEQSLVSTIDWYPTLLDLLDIPAPAEQAIDGVSILPVLQGEALERETLFCHFPHYVKATFNLPNTWVRRGDWKLFRFYADNEDQSDRFELYNLRDDIGETNNLAEQKPELVRELNQLITEHLAETEALVPIPNPNYRGDSHWQLSKDTRMVHGKDSFEITSTGKDPFLSTNRLPKGLKGDLILKGEIRSNAGPGSIHWATAKNPRFGPEHKVEYAFPQGEVFIPFEIPFSSDNPLTSLRIDPGSRKGQVTLRKLSLQTSDGAVIKQWLPTTE
ncbi:sulfatase [Roseibacillus persicicus]|uniref:sulfatase n=1 Tax=Roseibacillus persicicus TaxID=454148 RepID=UPI00280D6194|nr:sulfatase [Roseibacillus persicicus]MDQ8192281.1 sulfatase [Roseibacillus persicicus]